MNKVLRDRELQLKTDPLSGVRSFFRKTCDLNYACFIDVNRLNKWYAAILQGVCCWETLNCIGRPTHWVVCDHSFAGRLISTVCDLQMLTDSLSDVRLICMSFGAERPWIALEDRPIEWCAIILLLNVWSR